MSFDARKTRESQTMILEALPKLLTGTQVNECGQKFERLRIVGNAATDVQYKDRFKHLDDGLHSFHLLCHLCYRFKRLFLV